MGQVRGIYLILMVVGSFVPLFLATPHLRTYGFSPLVFINQANATSAAAACFADITLSAIVLMIFVRSDLKRRNGPTKDFWITLALLPIGLITSLCYYLYRRECKNPLA